MLSIENIYKSFNKIKAIDDFSVEFHDSETVGIVGPNGSGKTTLINLITGMHNLDGGSICFKGERIDRLRSYEIIRKGIARSFQIPKPFKKLTVFENLSVPAVALHRKVESERIEKILDLLDLRGLTNERAENVSGGQQKLLEIGRALVLDPELLLLDEPTAGVHPVLRHKIAEMFHSIKGKTIVIVSHDLNFVRSTCDRVIVMSAGRKIIEGDLNVLKHPLVIEAYMGR